MKKKPLGVVFHYLKPNRFAFNALLGAIDAEGGLSGLPLVLSETASETPSAVSRMLDECDKIVVAMSFFTSQSARVFEAVKTLRSKNPGRLFFLAGGAHATGDPCGCISNGFDAVVVGEGEPVLPKLLRRLMENHDISDIPGIALENPQDGILVNPRPPSINLDDFPPFSPLRRKIGALEISRGCPFGCSFCQIQHLYGARMRHRSVGAVSEAVRVMALQPLTNIRFITPNAFAYGSPDGVTLDIPGIALMLDAIRSIAGNRVNLFLGSFPSEVRPEHVTTETLRLLKTYASNKRLVIGAQTGSPRMLKLCRRGHTTDQVRAAVALCGEFSLTPIVDFIYGLPGETPDDLLLTINLMRDFARQGAVIRGHVFMPLPGTRFSKAPPGTVSPAFRRILEKEFLPTGSLFGDWEKQEKYARA